MGYYQTQPRLTFGFSFGVRPGVYSGGFRQQPSTYPLSYNNRRPTAYGPYPPTYNYGRYSMPRFYQPAPAAVFVPYRRQTAIYGGGGQPHYSQSARPLPATTSFDLDTSSAASGACCPCPQVQICQ